MTPEVARYDIITDLLNDLLHSEYSSIKLIVCTKRESFLTRILASARTVTRHPIQRDDGSDSQNRGVNDNSATKGEILFKTTLRSIAEASKIQIAYCPSIDSLRAYLSVMPIDQSANHSQQVKAQPLLVIADVVFLHSGTSEFSAQGLSRTFALAVEAAAKMRMPLLLSEIGDPRHADDARGTRLWRAEVPLLSDSVKLRTNDTTWTRMPITVKRIAERWFHLPEDI
ncbi:MAG: hypothetical protein Q9227_004507 [Pyrenula ochraceoflavens]